MSEIQARTFQRVDTAAAWAAADPILGNGEIGVDVTNNQFRVGDGVKRWSQLPPVGATASQINAMVQAYLAANPPSSVSVATESISSGVLRVTITGGTTPPPTITTNPQNTSTNVGFARTLTAAATDATSVKWQVNTSGSTWDDIAGATSMSFSPPVNAISAIAYRAVFAGPGGTATSASATLQVLATFTPSAQPLNLSVNVGDAASFNYPGASQGFNRQWQVSTDSGASWADISGATNASYATAATTLSMTGYRYRCVATHPTTGNQVISSVAILTVTAPSVPVITSQPSPSSQTFTADQFTSAPISSAASNYTSVKWQYYQNSATTTASPARAAGWYDMPYGSFYLSNTQRAQIATEEGATIFTPNLGHIELVDSNAPFTIRLRAIYTNASGTTTTNEATITFNYAGV